MFLESFITTDHSQLRRLYPGLVGTSHLDSCRAFTVSYQVNLDVIKPFETPPMQLEDDQEVEDASGLDTHFDNAEARVANHTSGSYVT